MKKLTVLFVLCLALQALCSVTAASQQGTVYESRGRRDPFLPLVTSDGRLLKLDDEQEKETVLAIEGIIYDQNGLSYAIVNGIVVKVGDEIGNYQVLKIEKDKVTFIKEGQTQEIVLKKEEQ